MPRSICHRLSDVEMSFKSPTVLRGASWDRWCSDLKSASLYTAGSKNRTLSCSAVTKVRSEPLRVKYCTEYLVQSTLSLWLSNGHINSFNHFTNVDIKQIVAARSNQEIRSVVMRTPSSSCAIQISMWASLTWRRRPSSRRT